MKKYLFTLLAAGLVLTSCSNDDFNNTEAGKEVKVSFTTTLPSNISSRTYSDGQSATELSWAIYLAGSDTPLLTGTETFENLKATVSTTLVSGKSYDLVFWAQNPAAPYSFSATTRKVEIDYSSDSFTANNENLDAFFKTEKAYLVKGATNDTFTLTRPFAQVNIGTTDWSEATAAGISATESTVTIPSYTYLDVYEGTVSTEATAVFKLNAMPGEDESFRVPGCKYLAMAYVLMPEDKQTLDVTYNLSPDASTPYTFGGVPVQRNYRTNIYGALLTDPANFTVQINPAYGGDDEEYNLANFVAPGVIFDKDTNTYTVVTPEGLQWIATNADGKGNAYEGSTVKLGTNMDMTGLEFIPIGRNGFFKGTLDGNGYTISNLTVSDPRRAGLVWRSTGTIKDLTMTNVNVTGNYQAGAVVADPSGGKVLNCTVDGGKVVSTPVLSGSTYDDGNNVGGIAGYIGEPNTVISGCTVRNLTLEAYRTVGAIAGTLNNGPVTVTDNTAEDCTVIANQLTCSNYDGAPRAPEANELFGRQINGALAGTGNTASGVVVKTYLMNGNSIDVADAETFAVIASAVNGGGNSFEGKTINITSNLDFTGVEVEPLGMFVNTGGTAAAKSAPFMGTLNGNNNTISNFTTTVSDYKASAGFIGYASGGAVIKDLTLKDLKVTGTAYTGGLIGKADKGSSYVTIENVTIDGATILSVPAMGTDGQYDGGNNVGGLVGITQYGMEVTGCTVTGSTITGYAKVGGLFGGVCNLNQSGATNHTVYTDNKVENTQVIQSLVNEYESTVPTTVGEMYGQLFGNALPASNTATGVTVTLGK